MSAEKTARDKRGAVNPPERAAAHGAPAGKTEPGQGGFLMKLFGFGVNPERRRALRQLKRELGAVRVDLYRLKQDLIQVPVARMLYDLYRLTHPLKPLFPLEKKKQQLPPSVVDAFMMEFHSAEAREIAGQLTEEHIRRLIQSQGLKQAAARVEKLLERYFDCFDQETVRDINLVFSNLLAFARFTHFDFFPILREFDQLMEEGEFTRKPSFSPAEGHLLREDINTLNRVLHSFHTDQLLDRSLEVFSRIRNTESLNRSNLNRLRKLLAEIQQGGYFTLLIRAIDKNPAPVPVPHPLHVDIFNAYTFKRRGEVLGLLNTIRRKVRDEAVGALVREIFGNTVQARVKNYSVARSEQLTGQGLSGFRFLEPLNYVQAFCADKYRGLVAEKVNELIIGGVFVNKGVLNTLSNSYYALNKISRRISKLDEDLDQDGESGAAIKKHLATLHKNKNARNIIEKSVRDVNRKAELIINETLVNLKEMALCLKHVIEDYKREKPAYVANIRKIRSGGNREFMSELVGSYKLIYQFLRLLAKYVPITITRQQLESQKLESEAPSRL
ncbi:MAG: DUF5312 family protein [Spirochaetota bacterium]